MASRTAKLLPKAQREKFEKKNERPEGVSDPGAWGYLWGWFSELRSGVGDGFSGPAPITHETILAWRINMRTVPLPMEVRLILATDAAFRAEHYRLRELKRPKP